VYYTPIFHILSQFSQTIRPGDVAVETSLSLETGLDDTLIASASISPKQKLSVQVFNSGKEAIEYALQIGEQSAEVSIPANTLQTLIIQL
jgi:glucosylceramidase